MVLKDYDLLQLNAAYLHGLKERDPEALAVLSEKLLNDLKEARERLKQNPKNSSRPSGSMAPWDLMLSGDEEDDSEDTEGLNKPPEIAGKPDPADPAESNSLHSPEPEEESSTTVPPDSAVADEAAPAVEHQVSASSASLPNKPRPAGRQRGSSGFGRTQVLPFADEHNEFCTVCTGCGADLKPVSQNAYTGFYSVDVLFGSVDAPGLKLTNTLNRFYQCTCPACGLNNRTEPNRAPPDTVEWVDVELTAWRLVGPNLAALIVYLCMDMRLTRRKVCTFLFDLLGLKLSVGTVQNCLMESARALSPLESVLVQEVLSTALVHADETSHKESGALLWLWVFVTSTTALFLVGFRSKEIWRNLLDSYEHTFQGWLMTDGYTVYREYALRLRCWAHLIRKIVGLRQCLHTESQKDGKRMEHLMRRLVKAVYAAREGPDKGTQSMATQHQDTLVELKALCEKMKQSKHKKTHELAVEFLNDWEAIFRILDYPAWPLTNNEAERVLRHWVIWRKITQGTRSEQGSRALALFASVITTCRLRSASPLLFLRNVIQAARNGCATPALPVVPAS